MNTEFEKYARDQFDGHELEVDTENLWANVYPHVKKEKKRRNIIWFFLFGILSGIAILSLFNYQQNTSTSKNLAETLAQKQNSIQNNLNNQSTALPIDTTTPTTAPTETNVNKYFKNETKTKNSTSIIKLKNTPPTTPSIPSITKPQNIKDKIEISKNYIKETSNSKQKNRVEKAPFTPAVAISPINTLQPVITNQKMKPVLIIQQNDDDNNDDDDKKDNKKNDESEQKKIRKNRKLSLGVYGGISKSTNNFSSKDTIGSIYQFQRNTSEKQLETIHLGIDFTMYTKQNFYLRSGLEYTRIGSVFNNNTSFIATDSIEGIKEIIVNMVTGERDTIMGTIAQTTTTEFVKKHYNYVHLIDIPIIVGYQWEYEPWSIGIEGGIYANISAKHTGEISSPTNEAFYDLAKDENNWFKTNIGIQPFIGLNASYNLSENLQIHLSPGFRFNAVFSTDKNLLQAKQALLGLKTGVRYTFD